MALNWRGRCPCGRSIEFTRWNTDCFVFTDAHAFDYFKCRCACGARTRIFCIDSQDIAYAVSAHFPIASVALPPPEIVAAYEQAVGKKVLEHFDVNPRQERMIDFAAYLLDQELVAPESFAEAMP